MQEYLWKNAFREKADAAGFLLLSLFLCCGWFILLWGLRLQSLLAGLSLFGLFCLLRRQTHAGRLLLREQKLRRAIGGKMHLESMLLLPAQKAHFEMALLLSQQENLRLERVVKEGILCKKEEEMLLLSFLQFPFTDALSARDVLRFQQAACREGAQGVLLCVPCSVTDEGRAQAESAPPVCFVEKDRLISLLGAAFPATDSQLVALGKTRRKKLPLKSISHAIFQPAKARRYALYGAMLLLLYTLTGLFYYALPGLLCIALATVSHCRRH